MFSCLHLSDHTTQDVWGVVGVVRPQYQTLIAVVGSKVVLRVTYTTRFTTVKKFFVLV